MTIVPATGSEVIGSGYNFWLYSRETGYDITHREYSPPTTTAPELTWIAKSASAPKVFPRLTCKAGSTQLTLAPSKTALFVVDMQNYFLSPALDRPPNSPGLQVAEKLEKVVIPLCRNLNIPILWSNWGLKPMDILTMGPAIKHGFALDNNFTFNNNVPGLGADLGPVQLDGGFRIDGGKVLLQDTWNEEIYDPLAFLVKEGKDMKAWKNRMSGFALGSETHRVLQAKGVKTLIFAGCNAEQSIAATLMDAAALGYECVLLSDAAAPMGVAGGQGMVEYSMDGLGFAMTCEELVKGQVVMGDVGI